MGGSHDFLENFKYKCLDHCLLYTSKLSHRASYYSCLGFHILLAELSLDAAVKPQIRRQLEQQLSLMLSMARRWQRSSHRRSMRAVMVVLVSGCVAAGLVLGERVISFKQTYIMITIQLTATYAVP